MNNPARELVLKEQFRNMFYSRTFKIYLLFLAVFIFLSSCSGSSDEMMPENNPEPIQVITAQGLFIPVYDFAGFRPMLDYYNDTLYIFNFWATWCKPCVQELPYFNMADSAYAGEPVRIILVSLDFSENVESTLIPFMIANQIQAEVIVLDDMDGNSWIPGIDPEWEGAIPATLFLKKRDREFEVRSYTYNELTNVIDNLLNP
ncbi:MAG: TlpA family protein disulfide reductase [Bacteroidales bacterium]|nr:TlpA family protein disulfide reductase [Bacteroidales bacterium]